jgi:hypothetical protein
LQNDLDETIDVTKVTGIRGGDFSAPPAIRSSTETYGESDRQ